MAIDWNGFEEQLDRAIEDGVVAIDDEHASEISSLTRMTDEEIKELFPKPADLKNLAKLMKIVRSADARNVKIDRIVQNSEKFAGIVLDLVGKFV